MPADLFIKNHPSKDKVQQLVKLIGCECKMGRSAALLLLRPHNYGEGKGGHPLPMGVFSLFVSQGPVVTTNAPVTPPCSVFAHQGSRNRGPCALMPQITCRAGVRAT